MKKLKSHTSENFRKILYKDKRVKEESERLRPIFSIISRFIELQNKEGLTIKKLSGITGIPRTSLSRFLNARMLNPSIDYLNKIASAFGFIAEIKLTRKKAA